MSNLGALIEQGYLNGRPLSEVKEALDYLASKVVEKIRMIDEALRPVDQDLEHLMEKITTLKSNAIMINNEIMAIEETYRTLAEHRQNRYDELSRAA